MGRMTRASSAIPFWFPDWLSPDRPFSIVLDITDETVRSLPYDALSVHSIRQFVPFVENGTPSDVRLWRSSRPFFPSSVPYRGVPYIGILIITALFIVIIFPPIKFPLLPAWRWAAELFIMIAVFAFARADPHSDPRSRSIRRGNRQPGTCWFFTEWNINLMTTIAALARSLRGFSGCGGERARVDSDSTRY